MPLLMCPNCNEGMNEVQRNDVQIDICPRCRGVWLDRGELEKILEGVRGAEQEMERRGWNEGPAHGGGRRERHEGRDDVYTRESRHEDDDERGGRHGKRRRGGLFEMFDIFD